MTFFFRYFSISILLFAASANGQTMQGPYSPKIVTEQYLGCLSCPGTIWTNLNNVKKSDSMYATTQLSGNPQCIQGTCYYARQIIATNFGFTIPSNAIITGVKADVQRFAAAANVIYDSAIYLFKNNIRLGGNKADTAAWPTTNAYTGYGDSTDSWSATLTPADVNDTTFGIIIKPFNTATTGFTGVDVDHIQLSVYYKIPTSAATLTAINLLTVSTEGNKIMVRLNNFSAQKIYSLSLFSMTGQRIYFKEPDWLKQSNFSESINTEEFANGLYVVNISTSDGNFSKKVIIENAR